MAVPWRQYGRNATPATPERNLPIKECNKCSRNPMTTSRHGRHG
ncbi:hypothetical protein ADG881_557 [Alcanivorax sp. DG881]|nr:hypothetical protein ADG881_557 [Alcanivorax sp. DG881]